MIIVYPFLSSLLALSLSMKIKLVNEKDDQTQRGDAHHDWFLFSAEHLNSWGARYLLWLPHLSRLSLSYQFSYLVTGRPDVSGEIMRTLLQCRGLSNRQFVICTEYQWSGVICHCVTASHVSNTSISQLEMLYFFIWYRSKVRLSVAGGDSLCGTSQSHSDHIPDSDLGPLWPRGLRRQSKQHTDHFLASEPSSPPTYRTCESPSEPRRRSSSPTSGVPPSGVWTTVLCTSQVLCIVSVI